MVDELSSLQTTLSKGENSNKAALQNSWQIKMPKMNYVDNSESKVILALAETILKKREKKWKNTFPGQENGCIPIQ